MEGCSNLLKLSACRKNTLQIHDNLWRELLSSMMHCSISIAISELYTVTLILTLDGQKNGEWWGLSVWIFQNMAVEVG